MVCVSVRDNGPGIEAERVAYIGQELERLAQREEHLFLPEDEETGDLFGLRNVMTRIKLYYGKEAGLSIQSVKGEGATATISLPLDQCKESFRPPINHTLMKGERSA
jgi:two-component system sensor histidine kinase YesM